MPLLSGSAIGSVVFDDDQVDALCLVAVVRGRSERKLEWFAPAGYAFTFASANLARNDRPTAPQ